MHNIIEKNKKWLKCYSAASRILGWMIILFVVITTLSVLSMSFNMMERQILLINFGTILEAIFNRLPIGIILLGVAQLLKYISNEDDHKTPWLLKNGTRILYLFAVLMLLRPVIFYLYQYGMDFRSHLSIPLFPLADILILIGLGDILKHVLPMIDESRTLV